MPISSLNSLALSVVDTARSTIRAMADAATAKTALDAGKAAVDAGRTAADASFGEKNFGPARKTAHKRLGTATAEDRATLVQPRMRWGTLLDAYA